MVILMGSLVCPLLFYPIFVILKIKIRFSISASVFSFLT